MTVTTQPTVSSSEPEQEKLVPTLYVVLGVLGVVLVIGLLIALVIWLASSFPDELEAIRDIFIIMLALSSCGVLIVGILAVLMLVRLINMLEFEIKPILEKTNETISTVQGTTRFVSQNVVKPTITISGYAAALSRGLRTLLGNPKRNLPD
ncbi:MAG: hypothetical protein KA314_06455 [Chloroflexi bacterium]|nr:hypothetical protein [Chloroflexota bacterium]MBP8055465.1 hypothetical protein [Chloroflexota bacterium]